MSGTKRKCEPDSSPESPETSPRKTPKTPKTRKTPAQTDNVTAANDKLERRTSAEQEICKYVRLCEQCGKKPVEKIGGLECKKCKTCREH